MDFWLRTTGVLLSFIGLADATFLYAKRVSGTPLVCDILEGCNIVANSPHSVLFGIPLSLLGAIFFGGMVCATALLFSSYSNRTRLFFFGWSCVGILFSLYFLYVQAFLIGAWCVYCLVSAGTTFGLFFVAFALWRRDSSGILVMSADEVR